MCLYILAMNTATAAATDTACIFHIAERSNRSCVIHVHSRAKNNAHTHTLKFNTNQIQFRILAAAEIVTATAR